MTTKPEIKVPEGVKEAGLLALKELLARSPIEDWPSHERATEAILTAALEQLVEEVLGDEAVHFAWEQVLEEIQPEDVLGELRGQDRTREVLVAALNKVGVCLAAKGDKKALAEVIDGMTFAAVAAEIGDSNA